LRSLTGTSKVSFCILFPTPLTVAVHLVFSPSLQRRNRWRWSETIQMIYGDKRVEQYSYTHLLTHLIHHHRMVFLFSHSSSVILSPLRPYNARRSPKIRGGEGRSCGMVRRRRNLLWFIQTSFFSFSLCRSIQSRMAGEPNRERKELWNVQPPPTSTPLSLTDRERQRADTGKDTHTHTQLTNPP